jgi:hypothetical protein
MSKKERNTYVLIALFGLISILFIWLGKQEYVYKITREDGFIENLTAIFYLVGFVVGLITIIKLKKHRKSLLFPIIWTFLCFVFLGEETSWFQRLFNYSVPGVENVNAQNEFNFHNLAIFKGEDLFVDGKLSKEGVINFLKSTQNIFRIGFFSYFVLFPLLMLFSKKLNKLFTKIGYIKPHNYFVVGVLFVFGCSFVFAIISPLDKKMALAETREMLYAFFILMYVWLYIRSLTTKLELSKHL